MSTTHIHNIVGNPQGMWYRGPSGNSFAGYLATNNSNAKIRITNIRINIFNHFLTGDSNINATARPSLLDAEYNILEEASSATMIVGKSGNFDLGGLSYVINPNETFIVGVKKNLLNNNTDMGALNPGGTNNIPISKQLKIGNGNITYNTRTLSGSLSGTKYNLSAVSESTSRPYIEVTYEVLNQPPVNVLNTLNNLTLYENDIYPIGGQVSDADNGNTVTVRYQINANTARAIKAFVSNGTTAESFSKSLIFRGGNLYDGNTLIASGLADGVAHTLKVWATDDQGGTSSIIERTFYVVPNRAPSLSVNTPVISGNIDSDEFEITGSYNDLDKNTTTVAYRINGGSSVQVAEGTGGDFNFRIKFGQLKVGLNSIVVEAIDSYGAKTSRTVKLNKNEVQAEQLKSTARFKIHPPLNTATGIVLWVRRDENLALSASISMTQTAEAENFVQMENPRTAPMANSPGVVEDQFEYESASPAEKIILQLDMRRSSLTANEKIYLLVGVID